MLQELINQEQRDISFFHDYNKCPTYSSNSFIILQVGPNVWMKTFTNLQGQFSLRDLERYFVYPALLHNFVLDIDPLILISDSRKLGFFNESTKYFIRLVFPEFLFLEGTYTMQWKLKQETCRQ